MEAHSARAHHKQSEVACNRPGYREARWERAVKVYTVNQESKYLLIQNVHALGVTQELLQLFSLYGNIEEYRLLDEYPSEPYTDVYWIKFVDINAARVAKKKLDNHSFFGKNIHVCYAPEFESVKDTREKLQQRRRTIASKEPTRSRSAINRDITVSSSLTSTSRTLASSTASLSETPQWRQQGGSRTDSERRPPLLPSLPPPPSHTISEPRSTDPNAINSVPNHSLQFKPPSMLQHDSGGTTHVHKDAGAKNPSELHQNEASVLSCSQDTSLYSASGLSKSQRVAAFLSSSLSSSATSLSPGRILTGSACHDRVASSQEPRTSGRNTGHALDKRVQASHSSDGVQRVTDSTYPAIDHHSEQNFNIVHKPTLPPVLTGNKSVDSSIHNIREHMSKVWQVPGNTTVSSKPPKPKKRKRI